MYTQLGLYIDGKWNHGNGGGGEEVINPATEKPLAHLPHARPGDLDAALAAAQKGFQVWKAKSAYDRGRIIKKAADLMRERADHDRARHDAGAGQGLRRGEGRGDDQRRHRRVVRRGGPPRLRPHHPEPNPTVRQMVVTKPVGVVAAFTPWNFPTLTPVRKIAAALAAGCSIIVKASEETPGSCVELVKCFEDAGAPARRAQPGVRRAGEGLRAPDRVADRAQDLVHRLGAGRQASRRSSPPRA